MDVKSFLDAFVQDPVELEVMEHPVILMKCTHRVSRAVARQMFGELDSNGNATKVRKCPICRQEVTSYGSDHKTQEITTFFSTRFAQAQVDAAVDIELCRVGAQSGNINAMYLLGEHYTNLRNRTPLDLENGVKWLQAAAKNNHSGAKERIFYLYLNERLGGHIKLDPWLLKECILSKGELTNANRLALGALLEAGYSLYGPQNTLAISQYELAFHKYANESSSRLLAMFPKVVNDGRILALLLSHTARVYPHLNSQELIKLIHFAKDSSIEFLPRFISEAIVLSGPSSLKMLDVMLAFYADEWAQRYLKAQTVSSTDSAVLTRLAMTYLTNPAALKITRGEAADLMIKASFPKGHFKYHYFLGNYYADEKKYEMAIKELNMAVEAGHAAAWLLLGSVYERQENYKEALEAYEKAIGAKLAEGWFHRARYRKFGIVGDVNTEKAIRDAQLSWGIGSSRGLLLFADLLEGEKSYQTIFDSASQTLGDEAQALLGVCYLKGYGVNKNINEAELCFQNLNSDLSLCVAAKAYLEEEDETRFLDYANRVSPNSSDSFVHYLQGQLYERCDLSLSLGHYLRAAELGLWEAKRRIAELFINRKIPADVKVPMKMFEACFQIVQPNRIQMALKGVYLCTGLGLEQRDVKAGLKILSDAIKTEAIKAKDVGMVDFIMKLFTDDTRDSSERLEAYLVLTRNKTIFLNRKTVEDVAQFLQVVSREKQELEEWIAEIRALAPPSFINRLAQVVGPTENGTISSRLLMRQSMKEWLRASCATQ